MAPPRPKPKPDGQATRQRGQQQKTAGQLPWPKDNEVRIDLAAQFVTGGVSAADIAHAMWVAWQMKGNPDAVLKSVDAWLDAAQKIDTSERHLSAARDDLTGAWSGPAFESFETYTKRNVEVTTQNRDALISAASVLIDIYTQVVQAYTYGIQQINLTAAQIAGHYGGLFTDPDTTDVQVLNKALTALVTNITNRETTLQTTLAGYTAGLYKIRAEQVRLRKPNSIPDEAKDRGGWVRK